MRHHRTHKRRKSGSSVRHRKRRSGGRAHSKFQTKAWMAHIRSLRGKPHRRRHTGGSPFLGGHHGGGPIGSMLGSLAGPLASFLPF